MWCSSQKFATQTSLKSTQRTRGWTRGGRPTNQWNPIQATCERAHHDTIWMAVHYRRTACVLIGRTSYCVCWLSSFWHPQVSIFVSRSELILAQHACETHFEMEINRADVEAQDPRSVSCRNAPPADWPAHSRWALSIAIYRHGA